MYTYAANVWDLSIVQGAFSVAPCQTLTTPLAGLPFLVPLGLPHQSSHWVSLTNPPTGSPSPILPLGLPHPSSHWVSVYSPSLGAYAAAVKAWAELPSSLRSARDAVVKSSSSPAPLTAEERIRATRASIAAAKASMDAQQKIALVSTQSTPTPPNMTADMTALPKTDTNYTALSLIPTITGNTFAASRRIDICPQRKESSSTSHARNPFDLNLFDSAQCLMVRRWRLIGHFPILYTPPTRAGFGKLPPRKQTQGSSKSDPEVSTGWVSPSSRGVWGGDAMKRLST
jgi:hypothetical protein